MIRFALGLCVVVGTAALYVTPASAGMTSCAIGQRVKAPAGTATVVSIQGSACTVRVDGRPYTDVYAAFMLDALSDPTQPPRKTAAPPAATAGGASGGQPRPGMYQCVGGPAGNMKLQFFGSNGYANERGTKGIFTPGRNGQIKFVTGAWEGFYAKVLPYGRIGLTSVDGGTFYNMTCDPK